MEDIQRQYLKRAVYCNKCGWSGLSGQLIARQTLVCPECSSGDFKYLVPETPNTKQ